MSKKATKTTKNKKNEQDDVVTVEWLNGQDEFLKILFQERVKAKIYHVFRGEYYIDRQFKPVSKKEVLKNVRK